MGLEEAERWGPGGARTGSPSLADTRNNVQKRGLQRRPAEARALRRQRSVNVNALASLVCQGGNPCPRQRAGRRAGAETGRGVRGGRRRIGSRKARGRRVVAGNGQAQDRASRNAGEGRQVKIGPRWPDAQDVPFAAPARTRAWRSAVRKGRCSISAPPRRIHASRAPVMRSRTLAPPRCRRAAAIWRAPRSSVQTATTLGSW
jgi:hypothetical protein